MLDVQIPTEKEVNEMTVTELFAWAGRLISVQVSLTRAEVAVANRLKVVNESNIELQNRLDQIAGVK